MKKEFYNPLFESLLDTAKEYKTVYNYRIHEEANEKFKDKDQALKYFKMIFDSWGNAVIAFTKSCLIPDVKSEISKQVSENIIKLGTSSNSSLDNIIKVLKESSDVISEKISGQNKSETIKIVYKNFEEGVGSLEEAYTAYKERAGSMLTDSDLLAKINSHIQSYVEQIKKNQEKKK
jgi:hypothetical protein